MAFHDYFPPPTGTSPAITRERIGWLRSLLSDFRNLLDEYPEHDTDPSATNEAMRECRALADDLERMLPPEVDQPTVVLAVADDGIPF